MKVFCADGRIGDFSQLQFSAGKRQRAFHLRGQIDLEGRVLLQWEKVGGRGFVEDNDRLMVVVLHEGVLSKGVGEYWGCAERWCGEFHD